MHRKDSVPKVRIAHVVRSDAFAGVERYITYVAPQLARRGWEVMVVGGDPVRMADALALAAISHLPATTTFQAGRQLLRCRPLDLVHSHMSAAELAAMLTRPVTRAPFVTTRHFAARRGQSLGGRMVASAIARTVASEISISRFVADAIEDPSVVIPSGVPNVLRPSAALERGPRILMAQRLEPEKDTAVGIRAWALSGLAAQGWRLVIAGGGTQAVELRRLATELGTAGSVDLVGPQADVGQLFDQASIFLATAPREPFGLSVVEAMASALPVVASASGAHLETVGACSHAWLFPAGDDQRCALLLRQLASHPDHRLRYGADLRALQRQRFDLDDHVDRLVELYRLTLGERSTARAS